VIASAFLHDHAEIPVVTTSRERYDAHGMDEKAIRRAALITLRRTIQRRVDSVEWPSPPLGDCLSSGELFCFF
jgi:hypothetical protein